MGGSSSSKRITRRKANANSSSSSSTNNIQSQSASASASTRNKSRRKRKLGSTKLISSRRNAALDAVPSASATTTSAVAAPYVCETCGRRYQVLGTLTRHMRKECNQPKKYVCRMCGRGFHYNFKLQDHYYYVHKGMLKKE